MAEYNILLVEDDVNFGPVLRNYLELHEFKVRLAVDGQSGLALYKSHNYDLCIFDIMMPVKDGLTLASEIREIDKQTPIIFITAKTLREDIIKGYKVGADDYITKPFDSEVLLYKIKAMLKRSPLESEDKNKDVKDFKIGKYSFNSETRILQYDDQKTKLSPKEALLLRMLCLNEEGVLTRHEALTKIWHEDNYFTARSMDVYIFKLRKYLKADPNVEIVNLHGNGFRLVM